MNTKTESDSAHGSLLRDEPRAAHQKVEQLHSPFNLAIVKKMKQEGNEPSKEFVRVVKDKMVLLKEAGVAWKIVEMNRIFNHLGRQWAGEHPNVKLESTLLELEGAYKLTKDELGKVLCGNPALLALDVDATRFTAEEFYLRNLGFKRPELRNFWVKNPEMLTLDFVYMAATAGFMRSELGINK